MSLSRVAAFFCLLIPAPLFAANQAVTAKQGMVVCVSPAAADVGVEMLKKGGNAVDSAVAVAFAMAVTYPAAGNIGGGGFMLVYPGDGRPPIVFDYRETAPAAVKKDSLAREISWYTHRAVGVPGTVRGLELAHKQFGKLPWKDVVMPSVILAEDGFILSTPMATSLNDILKRAKDQAELQRVFSNPTGQQWKTGDVLIQKDLAATLRTIAEKGPNAFYQGPLADLLEKEMKSGNGFITKEDLAAFRAEARKPIHGTYRGYDVYGAPPPSSGGTCLVEMLNILETVDLKKHERWSSETMHLMVEASRRAFCDRARYLGDPGFVKIPDNLTSKDYAAKLAKGIDSKKATPSEALAEDIPLSPGGDSTTHFSVIDKNGMAVANTYTLEHGYGSRIVVKGAGYLLNNEMGDFNTKPGVTTKTGAIGTEPNQIAPGKRMLSSQSPTIVVKNGKAFLITGSPGSRTIINTVFNIVVDVIDYGMDIQAAVDAPRYHHQWFPDEIQFEGTEQYPELVKQLSEMGHKVSKKKATQGDAHSIWIDPKTGVYHGAADKRIEGKAAVY